MMLWTSSGSSASDIASEAAMSANRIETSLRSPSSAADDVRPSRAR
jgi:hypothetical protein